jgi:hypothetical protein
LARRFVRRAHDGVGSEAPRRDRIAARERSGGTHEVDRAPLNTPNCRVSQQSCASLRGDYLFAADALTCVSRRRRSSCTRFARMRRSASRRSLGMSAFVTGETIAAAITGGNRQ